MAFLKTLLLLSSLVVLGQCAVLSYNQANMVNAEFEVACSDTHMRIYLNRTALDERSDANNVRPWSIGFFGQKSVEACNINNTHTANQAGGSSSFSSYAYIEAALPGDCGIQEREDMVNILYNQTIVVTYGWNPDPAIRREEYDYYHVMCLRNRTVEQTLTGDYFNTTFRETGVDAKNNTQDFSFSLTHLNNLDQTTTEYKLGEKIKFSMDFNTAVASTKAIVQKCWSTSDGSTNEYKLIDNRCPVDPGTQFDGAYAEKVTKFKVEAYRYLGSSTSSIYVECLVRVCLDGNSTPECTACASHTRKRRAVTDGKMDETDSRLEVVRSPIFYIVDATDKSTPAANTQQGSVLSGTTGIIVIVLLSLLVFIAALAVVKKLFFNGVTVQVPSVSMKGIDNKGMA